MDKLGRCHNLGPELTPEVNFRGNRSSWDLLFTLFPKLSFGPLSCSSAHFPVFFISTADFVVLLNAPLSDRDKKKACAGFVTQLILPTA